MLGLAEQNHYCVSRLFHFRSMNEFFSGKTLVFKSTVRTVDRFSEYLDDVDLDDDDFNIRTPLRGQVANQAIT